MAYWSEFLSCSARVTVVFKNCALLTMLSWLIMNHLCTSLSPTSKHVRFIADEFPRLFDRGQKLVFAAVQSLWVANPSVGSHKLVHAMCYVDDAIT